MFSLPKQSESVLQASECAYRQLRPAFASDGQAAVPVIPTNDEENVDELARATARRLAARERLKIVRISTASRVLEGVALARATVVVVTLGWSSTRAHRQRQIADRSA